jgi:hypothetical protein
VIVADRAARPPSGRPRGFRRVIVALRPHSALLSTMLIIPKTLRSNRLSLRDSTTAQGEWVSVLFNLGPNKTLQSVMNEMSNGSLRVGMHVQAFGDGGSEAFVNQLLVKPPTKKKVVEPGTIAALECGRRGCRNETPSQNRDRLIPPNRTAPPPGTQFTGGEGAEIAAPIAPTNSPRRLTICHPWRSLSHPRFVRNSGSSARS